MRLTPDALRDLFVLVVQTRQCHLCTAALAGEAVYEDTDTVLCVACSLMHGAARGRCHVVWTPEIARRLQAPDLTDLTD